MDAILNWLWQGCVLALAAFLVLGTMTRARAQVRYLLCWAALLMILVLPFVRVAAQAAVSHAGQGQRGPVVSVPGGWWTSGPTLIGAWALWSGVYAARAAAAMLALRRARRRCRPFPPEIASQLRHWARVNGRGRQARLVISHDVRAAAVLGCGRPLIAVSPAVVRHLGAGRIDAVVIHEWAHVRRRDDLANIVQLAATVIAGWHPAVWWINRRLQIEREMACDETVVAMTGSARHYAASLATLASLPPVRLGTLSAPGALSSPALSGRIVRLVSPKPFLAPAWSMTVGVAGILLLGAISFAVAALSFVETVRRSSEFREIRASVQPELIRPQPLEPSPAIVATALSSESSAAPVPRLSTGLPRLADRRGAAPSALNLPRSQEPAESPVSAPARPADGGLRTLDSAAQTRATLDWRPAGNTGIVPHLPPPALPAAGAASRVPWGAAAQAGVAVGRRSTRAGVATAEFFGRVGRRIAASF